MKAKDILNNLSQSEWIKALCKKEYPFITKMSTPPEFRIFSEVTIRLPKEGSTRFGKPKLQRRRLDAVVCVKPHYKAFGEECFSIGVEIKISKSDLIQDSKYIDYLGHVDFFFFAVPTNLVEIAIKKSNEYKALYCGVIDSEKGIVEKMPERIIICDRNGYELYKQIVFNIKG